MKEKEDKFCKTCLWFNQTNRSPGGGFNGECRRSGKIVNAEQSCSDHVQKPEKQYFYKIPEVRK